MQKNHIKGELLFYVRCSLDVPITKKRLSMLKSKKRDRLTFYFLGFFVSVPNQRSATIQVPWF